MTDFSLADFYVQALSDLDSRYRFTQCSNLISNLTDVEKKCAMFDALQDINSLPPQTSWALSDLMNPDGDPRWLRWFYLATARNCVRVLISDWTQNGFEDVIDEFKVEDRLDRYTKFASYLDTVFHEGAEELKKTSQKFFKSEESWGTTYNPVVRFRSRILFADGRAWRGQ
jgi:hypothetical protein